MTQQNVLITGSEANLKQVLRECLHAIHRILEILMIQGRELIIDINAGGWPTLFKNC